MDFYIHKDFFNLPFHLKWENNKLQKTNEISKYAIGTKAFEEISKLYLLDIPTFPPEKFLKAYKSLLRTTGIHSVPWNFCMPQDSLIDFVKNFGETLHSEIENLDISYYENYFLKGNFVLNSLKPAKINKNLYETIKDNPIVQSFYLDENNFAEIPKYSRIDTVSGRTKIISGPNILNLKKEYRNMLISRYGEDGAIYYLDFKSIEPRLLLSFLPNCGTLPPDIYADLNSSISKHYKVSREELKIATISEMYGAGLKTLHEQFPNFSEPDLISFASKINNYFGISQLKEKLVKDYEKNDKKFIKNLYGRLVSTIDIGSYALVNRFIQSLAVDVALIGFSNIVSYINEMNWQEFIVPIFVLHDALIIDVHKKHFQTIATLCKIGSIDIPLLENINFYIKAEKIT